MENIKTLLDTMELIHYIEKYKNKILIFVVTGKVYIRDIIPDIIILQSFNIKVMLVIGYSEKIKKYNISELKNEMSEIVLEISSMLKKNNLDPMPSIGTEVFAKDIKTSEYKKVSGFDIETFEFALKNNKIPIIAPIGMNARGKYLKLDEKDVAMELGISFKASTVFFISEVDGVILNGNRMQFLTYKDAKKILANGVIDKNIKEIMSYGVQLIEKGIKEFSILEGKTGNIYKEVLTYDISGTLISKGDDEIIRFADIEDVPSIYLLIKNEMTKNNILPITEDNIENAVDDYIVYEIDSSIVAAGKLNYYENVGEIAKIVTLPRYQGGKKAKSVCLALIEKAKSEKLDYVFGLTVNESMMKLFRKLGFVEVKRESFPEEWKRQYDFERPSKGFRLNLNL
ncbi:GNAT family N-acetyltransferase [Haliovirga abyssi]|uniref:amino-acid N-acetyltransferase n=1 Tax=Haliovirga abyssi TaxID=2996794 RepID=A0AAU9DNJ2_9FUSO|nr:GNAT family N-acetyltransferase [Haliovirga abyssi]BDU49918.1 hypothetical protein HLVA_04870 [Haliovirga abyssi]